LQSSKNAGILYHGFLMEFQRVNDI